MHRKNINMVTKIRGLKDGPIKVAENDALGLTDYAEALCEFILSADTPITIGIQGDWGSGKSSMMYLIEQKLKADGQLQDKKLHTMWFNTWQFSQFNMSEKLSISLLSRFIDEMESLTVSKRRKESEAKKALRWIVASTVNILGADEVAKKVLEEAKPPKETSENIANLQVQLVELVDRTLTEANLDRIVVFIDDIDRLIPQKAVELLEALKLFLEIEGCVYVLACDYQVIVQGLRQKFGVGEAELKGRSFFDKIIQVPFKMPVNQYDTEGFCKKMLEHIGVAHKKSDIALYLALITYSAGFNPRTVKRLFNNLLLLKIVLDKKKALKADKVAKVNEKMRILFATLCLQNTFSPVYDYLHNYLQQLTITDGEAVSNTNQLFVELREPGKFAKLWQDVKTSETFFNQLADFIGVFFDAIQLQSDTAEAAAKTLNAAEIGTLKTILSFSGMVAVQEKPEQPTVTSDEIRQIRRLNRDLIKSVISELESRYKKELSQLSSTIFEGFRMYQPRYGDVELYTEAKSVVQPANEEFGFTIALTVDVGSPRHSDKGEKHIRHHLTDYYIQDFVPWFKKHLLTVFPTAKNSDEGYLLYEKVLPPETSREELDTAFKESAFELLDKLLPKLAQLYRGGKL